jgi:hypothetical protein
LTLQNANGGADNVSVVTTTGSGYTVSVSASLNTIYVKPPVAGGAVHVTGLKVVLAIALASLALLSQRGSLMALFVVVAICVAAFAQATCSGIDFDCTILINQQKLHTATIKVPLASTKGATCALPAAYVTAATPALYTNAVSLVSSATLCTYTFTNPVFGCSNACGASLANANGASCSATGVCTYNCTAGYQHCSTSDGSGCETAINTVANCGSCTTACSATTFVNVSDLGCTSNQCSWTTCDQGSANCDGSLSNGCETNTDSDVNNCGTCNTSCTSAALNVNTSAIYCSAGSCVVPPSACVSGWLDCAGGTGGCQTNASAPTSCGSCGNDCTALSTIPNAVSGTCGANNTCSYTCAAGYGDCSSATLAARRSIRPPTAARAALRARFCPTSTPRTCLAARMAA